MPIHSFVPHYERMLQASPIIGVKQAFHQCCYQAFPAFWDAVLIVSGKRTLEDVKDRIRQMDGENYRNSLAAIKRAKIEQTIERILETCGDLLPMEKEPDVYLGFGFGSVAAGALDDVAGKPAIYFGLEFFSDTALLSKAPMWLAHEYCHMVWWERGKIKKHFKLKDKLIFEGLAIAFSELVCPGQPLSYYIHLSDEQIHWLENHEKELWNKTIPLLDRQSDGAIHHSYFDSTASGWLPDASPAKRGYYLGYRLVKESLKHADIECFDQLLNCTFEQLWSIARRSIGRP